MEAGPEAATSGSGQGQSTSAREVRLKTEEQKKADGLLEEAIDASLRAYSPEGEDRTFLTTDFVVVCAGVHFDSDGDQITAYDILYRNGSVPHYRSMGLLTWALASLKTSCTDHD